MSEKPLAAVLRENDLLRDVASKAIKLRRIGMALDDFDEAMERLVKETGGVASRSGTGRMMYESAFSTAMKDFDEAVLRAAEARMDWAGS